MLLFIKYSVTLILFFALYTRLAKDIHNKYLCDFIGSCSLILITAIFGIIKWNMPTIVFFILSIYIYAIISQTINGLLLKLLDNTNSTTLMINSIIIIITKLSMFVLYFFYFNKVMELLGI